MRIHREQKDLFYWLNRLFPWFFGAMAIFIALYFVGILVVGWLVVDAAVDAGPSGIAESLGKLFADFQRGAGK